MSKAFDSLYPPLLLKKLEKYRFSKEAIDMMKSYFENRRNRVKLGDIKSIWKKSERGCPQGSSLGPLLWNIYQNDLSYTVSNCGLSMYADDHQLYVAKDSPKEVEKVINENMEKVCSWYRDNFLHANKEKYQAMTVTGQKIQEIPIEFKINDDVVQQTKALKLLGVIIDDKLTFNGHISNMCKKASQKVGVLMRLRNLIPMEAKLVLYKTAILPHLTYCGLVFHFCRASDRRKLEGVQERALRAVFSDKQSSYAPLLEKSNLSTLYNKRLQDIAILMYKVKNNLASKPIQALFERQTKRYELRNAEFNIPRCRTETYGKHSIRYLGPMIWSKLYFDIKNSKTLGIFKNKLKKIPDLSVMTSTEICSCNLCGR
eukprot:gene3962-4512_t